MRVEQDLSAAALAAVLSGRSLTPTLERMFERRENLDARQKAAIFDITHGALRQLGLLRAVAAQLLRKPLAEVELESLLLVALHQLAYTRAAPYAVVDHAVAATRRHGAAWASAVFNAVLRRFLREREALLERARDTPEGRYSYPTWWIRRVESAYPEIWRAMLELGNARAPLVLRVNLRRTTRAEYSARLEQAGIAASPIGDAGLVLARPLPVADIPGFGDGFASVQDAGAQLAATLLAPVAGERVLDAFAAPGGKAAHLLERADIELTALDSDPTRLRRLHSNFARLGLAAHTQCVDAGEIERWWDGRAFDRVLADVPCTASGVVRRHPDIKWLRREKDVEQLSARAARLLDALWRVVRPGGKLLLATCSIFPEENRQQVDAFVGRHADARLVGLPGQDDPDMQVLPDESHDGFYYALLQRD